MEEILYLADVFQGICSRMAGTDKTLSNWQENAFARAHGVHISFFLRPGGNCTADFISRRYPCPHVFGLHCHLMVRCRCDPGHDSTAVENWAHGWSGFVLRLRGNCGVRTNPAQSGERV